MVHPQKSLKDTNTCKKEAKLSIIYYRLLSVKKISLLHFFPKDLNKKSLIRERDVLSVFSCRQFKWDQRKRHLIHILLPDWAPCFKLGTGTSLPNILSPSSRFQGGPSGLKRPPNFPTMLHIQLKVHRDQPHAFSPPVSMVPTFQYFHFRLLKIQNFYVKKLFMCPVFMYPLWKPFSGLVRKNTLENLQHNQQCPCPFIYPS